jgi:hypothetical protein
MNDRGIEETSGSFEVGPRLDSTRLGRRTSPRPALSSQERGFTTLLVKQNLRFAATVTKRFYVVERGVVVDAFARNEVAARGRAIESDLGP